MSPTSPGLRPRPPERCRSSSISTPVPPIMSLLSNYEGLRHQIERLVRENEELKKLVRLIRENHELKSAIKTQAGAMGISGISSMFNEGTSGSTLQTTDRTCPPAGPVSTNDPGLDELGLLSSLVDILNYSQSSSSTSPATSPISSPIVTSMSNTLTGALNDPQDNLLPKPRANHTLLNDPSRPHSPLDTGCHSPTASAATSTTGPKVIISTDGNKITMGWEPSPDVKPYNMAIVGQPIQTSTPTITVGTPVATFYRCPEASTQGSPSIAAMSSLLTSVPLPGTIPISAPPVPVATTSSQPVVTATSLHQSAPTSSPSTLNAAICQDTSNNSQRNILQPTPRSALAAHATLSLPHPYPSPPPRSCTSSSSANNARGARSSEPPNKNLLEMERKMAHRKTLKVNETPRDPKQLTWERLVGEIAFQLDRRILSNIFPERVRLYGFTVSNIPEKIIQASLNTSNHKLDEELCQTLTQRYVSVMNRLQSLGYNGRVHPGLTEQLVNAYGILRERPELAASEGGCYTMDFLQRVVTETVPPSMLNDALLLLSCLNQLSQDDGKPMFIW
ncbi:speriolin isoform X4 [Sarcophilus harrisii]|uniref:speriolin isoform X4 n=1 Tax=Sarcophilus harrisii TaxID=9305 RepID=UPI001301A288|nr:speriolin isoform X4 [Sarcophilus harrisii]